MLSLVDAQQSRFSASQSSFVIVQRSQTEVWKRECEAGSADWFAQSVGLLRASWRELKWVLMQNKRSSRADPSASRFPSSCSLPTPPKPCRYPPLPTPSCSTQHTQLVLISGRRRRLGTRTEPLAGKRQPRCTMVTNREKPHQTSSSGAAACQYSCVDVQTLCLFCKAKCSSLAPNGPAVSLESFRGSANCKDFLFALWTLAQRISSDLRKWKCGSANNHGETQVVYKMSQLSLVFGSLLYLQMSWNTHLLRLHSWSK